MKIYNAHYCAACYFRTAADYPNKKCLLQLTERCNLHCVHCFVSSNDKGIDMDYEEIEKKIVPNFIKHKVKKVTLTGGEPLVYPKLYEVVQLLCRNDIDVSICTNASLITNTFLEKIKVFKNVHFNVSLDGFSHTSHGRFRGNENPFLYDTIINNIKMLGQFHLLNGILVTPNTFSCIDEYKKICEFAKNCNAKYVLMNPLSQFGRGELSSDFAMSEEDMCQLKSAVQQYESPEMEIIYIRFPNTEKKPLSKCHAGEILYIFSNGDIAYCPYMAFAAKDTISQYPYKNFIMGNIFSDTFDWDTDIENYQFLINYKDICKNCTDEKCKKGCFATKISQGKRLEDYDILCPLQQERR
ncbi:MAG: radical SAM protein [Oscillospiraceae bacterium]|nr:radical SAM protein [Oscillospiraceae bacterium]